MEPGPQKDIAIAALGASVGIASVLVIFIGFLFGFILTFPSSTPNAIIKKYKSVVRWGLAPTAAAIVESLACYSWLLASSPCLYYVWTVGFPVVAIGFLAYAVITVSMI